MKVDSISRPRTIVGRWLLATILGIEGQRSRLESMLNGGESKSKWKTFDEPAVVEIACWLSIRRLLPVNANDAQITDLASDMRSKNRSQIVPGQDDMEDIVRAALGYQDVSLERISANALFATQGYAVGYAYFKLGMQEKTITCLVEEAERIAFEQGWNPPLAGW